MNYYTNERALLLRFFIFLKYFCILIICSQKCHDRASGLTPSLGQGLSGTQQKSLVTISGLVSRLEHNKNKDSEKWNRIFICWNLWSKQQMRGCACFTKECCLNDHLQSWIAVGNSFGSKLKIQLPCHAKSIIIPLMLPYWQRLQGKQWNYKINLQANSECLFKRGHSDTIPKSVAICTT